MRAASSMLRRRVKPNGAIRFHLLWILLISAVIAFFVSVSPTSLLQAFLNGQTRASSRAARSHCSYKESRGECNFADGSWVFNKSRLPLYREDCPFHRNAWNCGKNRREGLDIINRWKWVPRSCNLPEIRPVNFLSSIRNMNLGFVGDSLNENLLVSMLCVLASADPSARRWKRRKAWRGAYFPKYNVTVGYHRAVLLAEFHEWKATKPSGPLENLGYIRGYQVNVDKPASDWINITEFYDVIIFNTGHCHSGGALTNFPQILLFCSTRMGSRSSRRSIFRMD
ncbi:hypothetical protein KP509_11G027400 [Ceratopteris richardii]|uniref:Trichome birefringence-like N-terminal domain-containing protein n=1 Tax=Ceratopteris richardii TaxID=49495 RepID=A0A8T2TQY2_CERRI|nr:hypothetical protein KP509_11G027400 [Ceratopteris richardii]